MQSRTPNRKLFLPLAGLSFFASPMLAGFASAGFLVYVGVVGFVLGYWLDLEKREYRRQLAERAGLFAAANLAATLAWAMIMSGGKVPMADSGFYSLQVMFLALIVIGGMAGVAGRGIVTLAKRR